MMVMVMMVLLVVTVVLKKMRMTPTFTPTMKVLSLIVQHIKRMLYQI